jgi:hypothetical protein
MPLESGTYLSDLDETYPLSGDPTNKGDDHLRLIKRFLINTFPGIAGNGFAKALTATEDELNFITGLTSNAQDQFDNITSRIDDLEETLPAPTGTKMSFFQAAAPTGWTQDTSNNNAMMRVINSAGGGAGGSDSPIVFNSAHTHATGSHVLTEAQMPSHRHNSGVTVRIGGDGQDTPYGYVLHDTNTWERHKNYVGAQAQPWTSTVGSDNSHNHGNTVSGGSTFEPKYVDMIICAKD